MTGKYILGLDQSTQGTKLLLFDAQGKIAARVDRPHRQLVNEQGWVSHDMEEVYENVKALVRALIEQTGIDSEEIAAIGITNQRETTAAWDDAGKPYAPAIVWQCGRAAQIAERLAGLSLQEALPGAEQKEGVSDYIRAVKIGRAHV